MSNITTGRRPDPSPQIMPSVSRRSLLGGLAASAAVAAPVAAASLPVAAEAAVVEDPWTALRRLADALSETLDQVDGGAWRAEILPASAERYAVGFFRRDTPSPLDELIAEYDRLDAEWERLLEVEADIEERTPLRPERVLVGVRKWWKHDGTVIDEELFAHSGADILRTCTLDGAVPIEGAREASNARLDRLLAEWSGIKKANAEARQASGLAAAERASKDMGKQAKAALHRVYAYRPVTVDEFRKRDQFVARATQYELPTEAEHNMIFGACLGATR